MVKFDALLHGGDYNPEQWLEYPEILEQDLEMMKKAKINIVSIGIFSWAMLEPEEGVFQFEWLEQIMDRLYENGVSVFLATPSGARPKWLSDKYPEVLRVASDGHRNYFGIRHNHCYTSPVYREKVKIINQEIARRLGKHPAVKLWHISNEYGGECYCPLCQQEFRNWLKEKYQTIEELNRCWCTTFWSHSYNSFDQIEAPSPRGEHTVHALNLDWKRFVSDRTIDFMRYEIQCLRDAGSDIPVTTNMMYHYDGINYPEMARYLDIVSWDDYPTWYKEDERLTATDNSMMHDMLRSMKKQPFLLMESCPSSTNWQSVSKLKHPGLLRAACLQAIAHGSDSVQYFQIRQSQGAWEKFHGAVIDHYGGDTRVFREVAKTGEALDSLKELCGTMTKAQAVVLYDWDNRWALEDAQGPRNKGVFYKETAEKSYRAFRKLGLDTDIIDMGQRLDGYKIAAIPMLYMFKEGFAEKVRSFIRQGGTVLMTYWSGIVDETDRCFLGGTPHGLMDVFGLRSAEIDGLYDWESNAAVPTEGQDVLKHTYKCTNLCELVEVAGAKSVVSLGDETLRLNAEVCACEGTEACSEAEDNTECVCSCETAEKCDDTERVCGCEEADTACGEQTDVQVLAVYESDFYAGTPALTYKPYGDGHAYYICADFEQGFYDELYASAAAKAGVNFPPIAEIPYGMEVTQRTSETANYVILQNFGDADAEIEMTDEAYVMIYGRDANHLKKYETVVLKKAIR